MEILCEDGAALAAKPHSEFPSSGDVKGKRAGLFERFLGIQKKVAWIHIEL
jgi:hypothetical protein